MAKRINISDDDIKTIIEPELERAKEWGQQLADERKRCRELYDMAPLGNEVDGFSSSVASTVFEVVEWLKPGFQDIFTHPDFFVVKMANADQAERVKDIVRYQLFTQQNGQRIVREYLDTALKYHVSVLKTCYVEEFDDVEEEYDGISMEEADYLQQQGVQLVKYDEVQGLDAYGQPYTWLENVKAIRREIKFRGPKVMPIPPWEFYISPGSKTIDDARLCAHVVPKRLHDIKAGENAGLYRKGSYAKLKERAAERMEEPIYRDERTEQYEQDGLTVEDYAAHEDDHKAAIAARRIDVWEIYTSLDIDNDGLLEPVIIRMADDEILNVEENPYKRPPFRAGRMIEIAHRFEGRALPLVLESDQKELTNLNRLFVDSAAEAAYPTAISGDQEFLRQWVGRTISDGLYCTGNPNEKIHFERSPGPDQNVVKAIEMREGIVERKSGVSRYNQGVDANSLNKTATGISIISTAGQQRQKAAARILGESLSDVIRDMIEINRMWQPFIEDADLQPEEGLFAQKLSIEIEVGVGPQDRMAQSQYLAQHQQWLTGFAIPAGAAGVEHSIKTQAKIGKLQGVPFDDLMRSAEDMESAQQMQQQMQQLQQQMAQMGQQIEQASQFIEKLQQENGRLKSESKEASPIEVAKTQAEMTLKQRELEQKGQIEAAKIALEEKKLAVDAQIEVAKLRNDVALAQNALGEMKDGVQGIIPPAPAPLKKQISIIRDANGVIAGAEVVEA